MTLLESIAAIASLLSTYWAVRKNMLTWPVGLLALMLYAYLFWEAPLYGEMAFMVICIPQFVWGWMQWRNHIDHSEKAEIERLSGRQVIFLSIIFPIVWLAVFFLLKQLSDAKWPMLDSLVFSLSLIAQQLLGMRKWENWLVWILADALGIWLFWGNGFHITVGLYFIYLILAVLGLWQWRKTIVNH